MATGPLPPTSKVWPSAGAFTTASVPILPPAPLRFSTTNGCPMAFCNRSASVRPMMSGVVPAG
jgi:hypothetical protein